MRCDRTQQCANRIISLLELRNQSHNSSLLMCFIGNGPDWHLQQETYLTQCFCYFLSLNGIQGKKVAIVAANPVKKLQNPLTSAEVEAELQQFCKTYKKDKFGADKVRQALDIRFPSGWHCAMAAGGSELKTSFRLSDKDKLLYVEFTDPIGKFIVWAWKG